MNKIIGICNHYLHEKDPEVDISTFEYKGCWNCEYFSENEDFPYYDVGEASKLLNVSRTTIINWIKKDKLKGRIFIKKRSKFSLGPWKLYYIEKVSVDKKK